MASTIEIFLCYAHEDEPLLNKLKMHLRPLQRESLINIWHDRAIGAGAEWEREIASHLDTAQIILLLVSPDFINSDYCYGVEVERALVRHEAREASIIPILLCPVDWQGTPFGKLQALPRSGKPVVSWSNHDEAFFDVVSDIRKIVEDLAENLRLDQSLPIDSGFAKQSKKSRSPLIWSVPYARNPFFTGREDILAYLRETLAKGKTAALTQAISGLGGIGKTQTAIEYAYRYCDEYKVVLWARADSREILVSDFMSIADLLDLPEKSRQDQNYTITSVKSWLQNHNNWLLIIDNVDDLVMVRNFIPLLGNGHVLLTTRLRAVGRMAQCIELDKMKPDEGALFLLRGANIIEPEASLERASEADRIKATEVSLLMDGLPLALDQAGAYIEETACGLSGYLDLYRKQNIALLKRRGSVVSDHPEPVFAMWSQTFERIQQTNNAAAELLRFFAFLYSEAIPEEIIAEDTPDLGPILASIAADPLALNAAIGELLKFSLLRRDPETKVFTIHRLVQAVIRNGMDEETQRLWAERVVRAVNHIFPYIDLATLQLHQRYLPHAQICVLLIDQFSVTSIEAAQLLYQLGSYLRELSDEVHAEPLYLRALAIYEQRLGPDHLHVATCLDDLAGLYRKQEKYNQAVSLYLRALAICEHTQGSNYSSVATSLNNLAELYRIQGNYDQAEPLYKRALTGLEKTLGSEHPYVATILENYAILLQEMNRKDEAIGLRERSILIQTKYAS